jgi:hypothetical protein
MELLIVFASFACLGVLSHKKAPEGQSEAHGGDQALPLPAHAHQTYKYDDIRHW